MTGHMTGHMTGRLIAVVGPSGVGKDSVMQGIAAASPSAETVQRVITRAPDAGSEHFMAVSVMRFEEMRAAGAFCLSWGAHGLHYGIPDRVRSQVAGGAELLVNLSRGVLPEAHRMFPGLLVLNLTTSPEVLAQRLAGRGRESADEIERRLARAHFALPEGINAVELRNDGPLEQTVAQALAVVHPVKV